jgi:hypothetical protein
VTESELNQQLRDQAVYFKLYNKGGEGGGAISVYELMDRLRGLMESYAAFVEIEYERLNKISDKKLLKKVHTALAKENSLMVVDLKFESCGMAVAPNTNLYYEEIPRINNPLEWKSKTFDDFKETVISGDYDNSAYLKKVSKRYTPDERNRIFKPFMETALDKGKTRMKFGFGKPKYTVHVSKLTETQKVILMPAISEKPNAVDEDFPTTMAMVELRGNRTKVLDLFDQTIDKVIIPIDCFSFHKKEHKLKYPLFFEVIHENNVYYLSNDEYALYAMGNSLPEAKENLGEEFHHTMKLYNSHKDDQLTDDVKRIKDHLKLLLLR